MSYARQAVTRLTLDMGLPDVQKSVSVTAGDTNRRLEVTLIDRGSPFALPPTWTAVLAGVLPSGDELYESCVVDDGRIVFDFVAANAVSSEEGVFAVAFDVFDEGGELVASPKIWMHVTPGARRLKSPDAADALTALRAFVGEINKVNSELSTHTEQIGELEDDVDLLGEQLAPVLAKYDHLQINRLEIGADVWSIDSATALSYIGTIGGYDDNEDTKAFAAILVPMDADTVSEAVAVGLEVANTSAMAGSIFATMVVKRKPAKDMRFAAVCFTLDNETGETFKASCAIVGVGSGGGGGGESAGGVDQSAVEAIVKAIVPGWAREASKPTYSKGDVNLGNVDNVLQYSEENPPPYPVTSVNSKTGAVSLTAADVGARPVSWTPTASDVGAEINGTASALLSLHNVNVEAHNDIRLEVEAHRAEVNALLNSDDETLNETKEIVEYVRSNKALIDAITTSKVSVTDIINNLTTNVENKPLSAAQGVALKTLTDGLQSGKLDAAALTAAKLAQVLGYTPANAANVPTALSQLSGDSTNRTVTDTEKSTWNGKLDATALTSAINTALAQAEASGAFKGDKGDKGDSGVYVGSGDMPEGYNVQIDPEGEAIDLYEMLSKKVDKAKVSLGIASDGLVYIFVDGVPVGTGIPQGQSGDVFGYVDENNTVVLTGNLSDGTYAVKYEMDNGEVVNVGNMVLDSNVYCSVTSTLTNCSISNSTKTVVAGGSYSATITANSGYELKSVTVTMGGSAVSVSGGIINIASVTGNIVITAVAEVSAPAYTNQIPLSIGTDGKPYNNGQGYKTGYRLSLSGGGESAQDGTEVVGFIPVTKESVLRIKDIAYDGDTTRGVVGYDANFNKITASGVAIDTMFDLNGYDDGNGVRRSQKLKNYGNNSAWNDDSLRYIRLCSTDINANSIITVDEEIV